ncbi:hypothetical protein NC651_035515 [Populus alba x Populus x berolinensis]|nr:hypothetical protein NC651_035515 [Populus alba x Populus x berolinensis]
MTKPMGSEQSVMLIYRLFLLNFLLLWQPGTWTNSTSTGDRIDEVERSRTLPYDEVLALRLLSQNLLSPSTQLSLSNSTQLSLSSPICSEDLYAEIKCGSPYKTKNGSFRSKLARTKVGWIYSQFNRSLQKLGKTVSIVTPYTLFSVLNLQWSPLMKMRFDHIAHNSYLYNNQLSGGIPSTLGQLQHLNYLDLSSNSLTGSIPPSLTMLRNLTILDLSSNDLDGTIPSNLKGLQSLRRLDLSWNKLIGPIPDSIGYCQNLTGMYLYNNLLSGPVPKELGKLSALLNLKRDLDGNDLHGTLPEELGNLTNLRFLDLTANSFTGTIPTTYAKLTNLEVFAVGGNYLSGPIPGYIGKWVNLAVLVLIGNNFSGNLPAETFNMTNLQILRVSDVNNPGISFPKEFIPETNSLFSVVLRNCNISGPIPEYIGKWPRLSYLDLSFNNLNGSIPETFGNLTKLFLTRNMLTGLPSWITSPKKWNISRTTV